MLGIGTGIVYAGSVGGDLNDITDGSAAGLKLWLKNDTGILADGSRWRDSSGNDNHVNQSTEGNRASLYGGGLKFQGGQNDHYDLTNTITIAAQQGFCLAAVVGRNGGFTSTILSDGANEFFSLGIANPPHVSNSGVFRFSADAPSQRVTDFHFGPNTFGPTGTPPPNPSPFLILLNRSNGAGNQFTFMKNGNDITPDTDASSNEAVGENSHGFQVSVLGAKNGSSDYFNGNILELAFWNRSLTTVEIADVNSYLQSTHGL